MRPGVLFPLFADITALKGIGSRLAPLYRNLCGPHVVDLLWHLPSGVVDRRYAPPLKYADRDRVATLKLRIAEHAPPRKPSLPYRIVGTDGTDQITLTYFNAKGDYLPNLYPTDRPVVVSGLLERWHGGWTMSHPDYAVPEDRAHEIPALEPVYPLTAGLAGKGVRRAAAQALERAPDLPEWLDPALQKREAWPGWKQALLEAHDPLRAFRDKTPGAATPEETADLLAALPCRRRLAYDELLADQLALALLRHHNRRLGGRALGGDGALRARLEATLPFALTGGQRQACAEIAADMASPRRMLRLLQGDVGSGKTVVALHAMLHAVEAGYQAALMAPTELLARQHHRRLSSFLEPLGLTVGFLGGKGRGGGRAATLDALADGTMSLVTGTHALFQDDVRFAKLGLAVVDEQHRFGVQQRLSLAEKGQGADVLVMTATPIPRTLTLTAYGDMDVSRLLDRRDGRPPIDTRVMDMARLDEILGGVERRLASGAQAYWVCPLIEESETADLAAATARADLLARRLGADRVGLVHGRMTGEEKDRVMTAFAAGSLRLLVATTVIEIGIDVPDATLMILEHAERFGLAQMHQLRGRVGRGREASTCLLLYQGPLGPVAAERLQLLRDTQDGFRLAEEDLRLRGPGELLGVRQSGLPGYRLADLSRHRDLLAMAHDEAQLVLARDPELKTERGAALRTLLYLFAKDAAVKLFRAG